MRFLAKRVFFGVLVALCAVGLIGVLSACGGNTANYSSICIHNYKSTLVEPTCTESGCMLHVCTKCGDTYRDEEVPALGHEAKSEWKTTSTQHYHECAHGCGDLLGLANHDWDNGVIEVANSCDTSGKIIYTCTTCGFSRADVLPAMGHNIQGGWVASDPETHWHFCTNGNHKMDEALHNWDGGHVEKAPTCTEEGSIVYSCMTCGRSTRRTLAKSAHNKSKDWDFDDHEHWRDCLVCGQEFDRGSHVYSSSYVTKQPTCTESGILVRICSICGGYIKTEIPALGHKPSTKWSSDGEVHWHKCENGCGEKLEVEAHTFGEWNMYLEPTCTTNGVDKKTCSVCGKAEFLTTAANGHSIDTEHWHADESGHWHECENCDGKFDFEEHTLTAKETVPPTATEQGYTVFVCDECEEEVKRDFTDPLGE